jgi:hydrogenase 3 maturation protease
LRGDDAVGLKVGEELKKLTTSPKLHILDGGTAPENMTGVIKRLKPSHLVIIDAAEMKKKPGEIRLIDYQTVGGYSFSSHTLPIKVMIDFLLADIDPQVLIIGIQPANIHFGAAMSPAVLASAESVAEAIAGAL